MSVLTWTEVSPVLYQPRKSIRVASEILNMNLTLKQFLSLTLDLTKNGLHTYSSRCQGFQSKGILREVLSGIIWAQLLCHMAIKVFRSIITTAMCKCTVIRLFFMTRIWTLFKASPLFNLPHLIDVPWILLNCYFIQQIRFLRFQMFHLTKFTNGAHVMWFPACCFCHIDFRPLIKIKIQEN